MPTCLLCPKTYDFLEASSFFTSLCKHLHPTIHCLAYPAAPANLRNQRPSMRCLSPGQYACCKPLSSHALPFRLWLSSSNHERAPFSPAYPCRSIPTAGHKKQTDHEGPAQMKQEHKQSSERLWLFSLRKATRADEG